MSESDASLPDDDSSFHPSDYSESSIDDRQVATRRDRILTNQSPKQIFEPGAIPVERVTRKAENFSSINLSISGSSGGSPWVDDTGSSSSTSSDTSKSRILLSISEQIRFDEARERLKQAQKRHRPPQKSRVQSFDSSASISTGMHPLKPIDVTDAHDVLRLPPILENLRCTHHRHEDSRNSRLKSREILKIRNEPPKSRIVGISPSTLEGEDLKMFDRSRNSKTAARPVPPIVIPEFCCSVDDLSSLGVTFSYNKGNRPNHRSRLAHSDDNDLERGNVASKYESESSTTIGWIEQRTNLELFLLFSVATSSVALIALLTIIFSR